SDALQAEELHDLVRWPPYGRANLTGDLASYHRVGKHRTPGQEIIGLEHEAAVAAWPRDRASVELDLPGARGLEAGDDAQKRGLAAARGATTAMKSPRSIARLMSCSACNSPNDLPRWEICSFG